MIKRLGRISLIIGLIIVFTSLINANLEPSIEYGFKYPTSTYLIVTFPVDNINFIIGALPGGSEIYRENVTVQLIDEKGNVIIEKKGLTPLYLNTKLRRGIYIIKIMGRKENITSIPILIEIKKVNVEYDRVYIGGIISVISIVMLFSSKLYKHRET